VPVTARPAEIGSLRAVIHATGIVTPAQGAEFLVTPPETARILEVGKAEGDQVGSGDMLARFDAGAAAANVARQRAELSGAQALAENAKIAQARMRDFVERGLVARQEIDRADRDLADAQAAVARAQAALGAAEAAAARAIVRAPFAGIVANRFKNPGDVASTTDTVLRLVDPRRMEVTATVPSADAPRVVPGASARLMSGGGVIVRLTVVGRAGNIEARAGTAPVRLTFVESSSVPADTAVEVDIDAEERVGAVFVPAEALVRSGREAVVFVAAGNIAEKRVVTVGVETDERAEVTSGIKAGELVITRGQSGLEDGAAISVDLGG
jgi:cobalt-zinc-cadmium efflux system membrane fusion protein